MLKLIAKLLIAGALASSYSYVSYAEDHDAEELEDEGGDSDIDATPAADTKPDVTEEKVEAVAAPAPTPAPAPEKVAAPVKAKAVAKGKAKAKAKKAAKAKKTPAKKHS